MRKILITLFSILTFCWSTASNAYLYNVSGHDEQGEYVEGEITGFGSDPTLIQGYIYKKHGKEIYFTERWIATNKIIGHGDNDRLDKKYASNIE